MKCPPLGKENLEKTLSAAAMDGSLSSGNGSNHRCELIWKDVNARMLNLFWKNLPMQKLYKGFLNIKLNVKIVFSPDGEHFLAVPSSRVTTVTVFPLFIYFIAFLLLLMLFFICFLCAFCELEKVNGNG